ncbi:AP-1 complex subunit sigma-1 [Gossypium australe]|uniref:Adaptor AP-1 19 kDa protein n=1 Tax=Gossypium australe TaxID=47621 RepID=A0A5B6V1M4_9ROSI|nr:AP-1 complex subunit sigma-1 [Gossypium australe]
MSEKEKQKRSTSSYSSDLELKLGLHQDLKLKIKLHFYVAVLPLSGRLESMSLYVLQIHFVLLISRQGKVRLTKWYSPYSQKERTKVIRELSGLILTRGPKLCNFVEWRGLRVVYKRYASLYFCMCIDEDDNELEILEIIHHYVEVLDRYFGSVCELDLIYNFHKIIYKCFNFWSCLTLKAYFILDELLIAGELQEPSKRTIARLVAAQDSLVESAKEQTSSITSIIAQAAK